jgi:predicted metal-dependent hydrolase
VSDSEPIVKLRGGYLYVEADRPLGSDEVRELVRHWYRAKARELLAKKCGQWYERLKSLKLPELYPTLRAMKTRWGSCTTAGKILLNPELVKMPVQCIDYVIVHELCHLKILRHSPEFYRLLSRYLPDWRARKERLDRIRLPSA